MPGGTRTVEVKFLVSHYACCDCDYFWKKDGEANMNLIKMMKRLHEKKCPKTGRTQEAKTTEEILEEKDRTLGVSASNPLHQTMWEDEFEFSQPGGEVNLEVHRRQVRGRGRGKTHKFSSQVVPDYEKIYEEQESVSACVRAEW